MQETVVFTFVDDACGRSVFVQTHTNQLAHLEPGQPSFALQARPDSPMMVLWVAVRA